MAPNPGLLPAGPVTRPAERELDALAALLNGSSKVTLFCGRGCTGAHDPLMELAETLKSPIVHALGGKEHVEYDNPYDVGMTGLIGFSSGYAAMMSCDTLLLLGTDFPYRQFFPEHAKTAQVDIRPENLGRRCKLDLGLVGQVGPTIEALLPKLKAKSDRRASRHVAEALRQCAQGPRRPSPSASPAANRSTRSTWPESSARRRPTTRSSPPMSAPRRSGRRDTCK